MHITNGETLLFHLAHRRNCDYIRRWYERWFSEQLRGIWALCVRARCDVSESVGYVRLFHSINTFKWALNWLLIWFSVSYLARRSLDWMKCSREHCQNQSAIVCASECVNFKSHNDVRYETLSTTTKSHTLAFPRAPINSRSERVRREKPTTTPFEQHWTTDIDENNNRLASHLCCVLGVFMCDSAENTEKNTLPTC